MRTLACAACLAGAILLGWLIERVAGHAPQPPADEPLPPLTELQGLEWMACESTTCAHLETTHRRLFGTELWACTGCDTTRTAPVKDGAL